VAFKNFETMYIRKSVAAPSGTIGPGAAKPKNPNVKIIFTDELLSWPQRDAAGILMDGNFVFRPNGKMIEVYMTGKKQKLNYENEGDVDEESIKQMFEGSHPGNSRDIKELVQNLLGKDIIILSGDCNSNSFEMFGTPCAPMRIKPVGVFDDTRTAHDLKFEQTQATAFLPATFEGAIVLAAPFNAPDENLALTKANGFQYKLAQDALGTALDIASLDHDHGAVISLIGSGGADPFVLSTGAATAATVILKDGTDWAAQDDAVLDLKVYRAGATTYLIEQKRK